MLLSFSCAAVSLGRMLASRGAETGPGLGSLAGMCTGYIPSWDLLRNGEQFVPRQDPMRQRCGMCFHSLQ